MSHMQSIIITSVPSADYAWFLENVMIYDMNDKCIYDFPCERWLSGQDDDHRTYRTLLVDRQRAFVDGLLFIIALYFLLSDLYTC